MCPTDLPVVEVADVKASCHQFTEATLSWREFLPSRLLAGATFVAFALFIYVLLSFHSLLQPAFTTTEVVSALVMLGLVISRA
jgi:hypothetical protein